MPSLRKLIFSLLLPAFLAPDGMTLCLRRLLGEPSESKCASSCCGCKCAGARSSIGATRDGTCCLVMPSIERTLDPAAKKPLELPAPTLAVPPPAFELAPLHPAHVVASFASWHPPARGVPIPLPLRL